MWPFTKKVSDEEWLHQIRPLCERARQVTTGLAEANRSEDLESQLSAVARIAAELPAVASAISEVPAPASSTARDARKDLRKACRDYLDGVKAGNLFFRGVASDFRTMGPSGSLPPGVAGRLRAGRFAYQQSFFAELVKAGEERMARASSYILGREPR